MNTIVPVSSSDVSQKLTWMVWLLGANLVVVMIAAAAIVVSLLPKVERAVQTAERVEGRFQSFADEVQPVLTASAGKAIETIRGMDAERLSETATKKADSLMDTAAERAKRFLERDKTEAK